MNLLPLYRDDLLNRFASHTFTETVVGDHTKVEFKDGTSTLVSESTKLIAANAYRNIREDLVGPVSEILFTLSTTQRDAISTPHIGFHIYNITTGQVDVFDGSVWDAVGDGGGIYSGDGTIPTSTVVTLTDTVVFNGGSVGLGTTPDSSAILDIDSTTQGFSLPSMTGAEIALISTPKNGLLATNTDDNFLYQYDGGRAKWLSVDTTVFQFGSNGAIDGQNLRFAQMTDDISGALLPRNGTIISITGMLNGGNTTKSFDVVLNTVGVFTYALAASQFLDNTINVDVTSGDILGVFCSAAGASATDPTATVTIKWKI